VFFLHHPWQDLKSLSVYPLQGHSGLVEYLQVRHNDIQNNNTEYNNRQHNDTNHNKLKNETLSIITLSIMTFSSYGECNLIHYEHS